MSQYIYVLRNREQALAACASIGRTWQSAAVHGSPLVVVIETIESIRTLEQNKLYWAMLREISEGAILEGRAFSSVVWHEFFKAKYIGLEEVQLPDGTTLHTPISTTTLTKAQFADYITQIQAYAAAHLNMEFQ